MSPPSGSSDSREMIGMAEEELARLHRQLRIMEDDRQAFSEEISKKLTKQRRIINLLKNEQNKLVEDINIAGCKSQKKKDEKFAKKICKQLNRYDACCAEAQSEIEQIHEIDVQIKKLEQNVRSKRPKSTVTDGDYQERVLSGKKSVDTLQNRLGNVTKKFCSILTENKELREEIDHLLKERCSYNLIWDKLLKDMQFGKKFMVDLIEQATLAFDQREESCSKLEALKKRAQSDCVVHTEEMRELQRILDHYSNLREFLCVKGQKRILKDLEEKERKKQECESQSLENQVKIYINTLEKIQSYCNGEKDIDKISTLFLKKEEENFALFNYVNELNHEIETLTAKVDEFHEKIEEQIEISNERTKERRATIKTLQQDFEKAQKQAEFDQNNLKEVEDILQSVFDGIGNIFEMLKCDRGPILELLGKSSTINLYNVSIFLGTIEKKISILITEIYFAEKSMMTEQKMIEKVADTAK